MNFNLITVLCTYPAHEKGLKALIKALIDSKSCACINQINNLESHFIWQGKYESTREIQLIIKTLESKFTEVEQIIQKNHPYECPEIIAVPAQGAKTYLSWLKEVIT